MSSGAAWPHRPPWSAPAVPTTPPQVPTGAGSVEGMALDPVATAASNNPLLTTLVAAVSGKVNPEVNLVNTLNNGEFTVFAPVDSAFAKIDAATMTTLTTDSAAAQQDPDLPRGPRPAVADRGRRHPHHRRGRHRSRSPDPVTT